MNDFLILRALGLLFVFSILQGCMTNTIEEKHIGINAIDQKEFEQKYQKIWDQDLEMMQKRYQKSKQDHFSHLDYMSEIKSILFLEDELLLFDIYCSQTHTQINLLMDFYFKRLREGHFLEKKLAFLAICQTIKYLEYIDYPQKEKWVKNLFEFIKIDEDIDLKIEIFDFIGGLIDIYHDFMINPLKIDQHPLYTMIIRLNDAEKNKLLISIWQNFRKYIQKGGVVDQNDLIEGYQKNEKYRGEMILIASDLQLLIVNQWCQHDWWNRDFATQCQEGLGKLLSIESFEKLVIYIKELILHQKKLNIYDIEISSKFNLLLGHIQKYSQLIPTLIELIDLFLAKNRSSDAIYSIIDMLERIKPKHEALTLFLRYEKWTREHMANQPQGLTDRLRKGIRSLYESNTVMNDLHQK